MTPKEFWDQNYSKTDRIGAAEFYRDYWNSEGDVSHLFQRSVIDEEGNEFFFQTTAGSLNRDNPFIVFYPDLIADVIINGDYSNSFFIKRDLDFNDCDNAPFGITTVSAQPVLYLYGNNHKIRNLVFNRTYKVIDAEDAIFENMIYISATPNIISKAKNCQLGIYLMNCNASNGLFESLTDTTVNIKGIISSPLRLFRNGTSSKWTRSHIKLDLFNNTHSTIDELIKFSKNGHIDTVLDSYVTGEIRTSQHVNNVFDFYSGITLSNSYFSIKVDAPQVSYVAQRISDSIANSSINFINKSLISGWEDDQQVSELVPGLYAFPDSICKNPTILRETYGFPVFEADS